MTFAGSIAVLLIWFILSAGIGFAAMFYGPGAVTSEQLNQPSRDILNTR